MAGNENKLKHLDHIQAVIARMSTNSSLYKGWAITIAAALSGFAAVRNKRALLVIALVTTLLFWALDAYYLWLERGFVKLHKVVAGTPDAQIDFNMQIDKTNPVRTWLRTCLRPHLLIFYGAVLAIDIVGIALFKGVAK